MSLEALIPVSTSSALEAWRIALAQDGAVVIPGILEPKWIQVLRDGVDRALARPTPLGREFAKDGGSFFSDMYLSAAFPEFRDFAIHSPAAALAGELLGVSRVVLFNDELLVKEPSTARETPWHHDGPYWPLDGEPIVSVWVPLDPVQRDTGALEFIRGSHLWNRRFHPRDFDTGAARITDASEEPVPAVTAMQGSADILLAEADVGDCVCFNALMLHRAGGNLGGSTRRRAVVLRLVGPEVRYDPRPRTVPLIWAPRLAPGEPLSGELFPTLWTRPASI